MTEIEALNDIINSLKYLENSNEQTLKNLEAISASLNLRPMEVDETWTQIKIN